MLVRIMSGSFLTVSENSSRGVSCISLEVGIVVVGALNLLALVPGCFSVMGGILAIFGPICWLRYVISLLIINEEVFASGLVPDCPVAMVPFIFLVEVVSYLIRPCALFARIAINLSCRHLLLTVGGMLGMNGNLIVISLVLVLELGVALVQSFVFFLILSI